MGPEARRQPGWEGEGLPEKKSQGRAQLLTVGCLTLSTLPFPSLVLERVLEVGRYAALGPVKLLPGCVTSDKSLTSLSFTLLLCPTDIIPKTAPWDLNEI